MASAQTTASHGQPETLETRCARLAIYHRTKLFRDVRRALAAMHRTRAALDALTDHDVEEIRAAWARAGLPVGEDSDSYARVLDDAEMVIGDARGFGWSLDQAISVLESYACPFD